MDLKSTLLVVAGSVCSFKLLNTILRFLPTPEQALNKSWRWRNISTSLAHSSLSGAWAVLCFYLQPQLLEDLISRHSLLSHSLVAVSTGYFIHDLLDVALNRPCKQSWEVLLHHSAKHAANTENTTKYKNAARMTQNLNINQRFQFDCIIQVLSCFGLALTSRLYVGYCVVSLLIEINSVFLHIRQLLLLSGRRNRTDTTTPRPSVTYSVTSWLTLATMFVFRVCTVGWMTRWLVAHSEHMPRFVLTMGATGLSLISIMNVVLLYRLIRADFISNTHNTSGDL
ncbi:TLC domain-containing protein 2-like isoform X1 [Gymnodraco acuticeps]|uniref:TLC domain-containing protein 2-like isoform X1 n=1 Tax=Gymnodraco acuticeps TaxID=8218 RepID=A0A6P8U5H7_GYMAC|nr:TLC domain-containing protein 2-like isoform X1 [Gymnodraco acuticeps]XP_034062413.1 TLC domain-containing protein 2-like isoform X1 [Gymnodraco acuticeps]XP_034062414.1 TLC domain-containing protein 2-like isoform X1 [Gymnodraco acuticeps]XP_034062415.1 TLC domain-containing protein 2-like isoform X1 [Gymnodraco acuticeps]XP_034062416.1 TLC domain-containing protein 2-like isoform X1 [Gymnodraco acuticeps]XP_034062417.1 TLC domain-containing protein 2-like isoform X1 [Gymnodraco acuticeps]